MSSTTRVKSLSRAVRAALAAGVALAAAPAVAGDHEIYSRDNFTLSANLWASVYAVYADNVAFGGANLNGETGSVSNFEYAIMPGLTFSWDHGDAGEIYGGFSVGASGNAGDGDPGGYTPDGESVFRVNEGYLGWRGDVIDFSVGRQQFMVGDEFLIGRQTEYAGPRNPYWWTIPFRTYDNSAIVRFDPEGPVRGDFFWLRFDQKTQANTQMAGLNVEYAIGEEGASGTVGAMVARVIDADSSDGIWGNPREGMEIYDIRASKLALPSMPDLTLSAEFVLQTGSAQTDETGWYVEPGYTFSNVAWTPSVFYRYSSFSKNYDPFSYFFSRGWGTWFQGEVTGEYYLFNNNQNVHMVNVSVTPLETLTVSAQYYNFALRSESAAGVTSDDFADEIGLFVDWLPTDNWYAGGSLAYAMPGDGGNQLIGGTDDNMFIGEVYVQYTW